MRLLLEIHNPGFGLTDTQEMDTFGEHIESILERRGMRLTSWSLLSEVDEDHEGLARRDHSRTAREAAVKVFPRSGTQRHRVYALIHSHGGRGLTRDQVADYLGMGQNTVRPRVKELLDGAYLFVAPGFTRKTATGHKAEVLVASAFKVMHQ